MCLFPKELGEPLCEPQGGSPLFPWRGPNFFRMWTTSPARDLILRKRDNYLQNCDTEGRVVTSGHFFIVSNHKVFHDVAFRSSLGRFLACQKSLFCEKNAFVFLS